MRDKFAHTVANARARGIPSPSVVPYVALGASYHRNTSHLPNINAQAKEPLPDVPFFDNGAFDFSGVAPGGGYDLADSMLMGAQINNPEFNNNAGEGRFPAFGPWQEARAVVFFPSIFAIRSAPSTRTPGSSVIMDHFVEYVRGATTAIAGAQIDR